MDDKTFNKIQALCTAILAIHPTVSTGNKKEMELYSALHYLNIHMKDSGCKEFDLSPQTL